MLEDSQLGIILKALESSTEHLEKCLFKYKDYISEEERVSIIKQIQEYTNTSIQVAYMIGNKELSSIIN